VSEFFSLHCCLNALCCLLCILASRSHFSNFPVSLPCSSEDELHIKSDAFKLTLHVFFFRKSLSFSKVLRACSSFARGDGKTAEFTKVKRVLYCLLPYIFVCGELWVHDDEISSQRLSSHLKLGCPIEW
jgi:hypothetical protein